MKKKSKKPFATEGMTVDQILSLGTDELSKMSKRDLSHALRTVSLAANKRVNRLLGYSTYKKGKYVEKKSSGKTIALDSLNKLLDEAGGNRRKVKFSVGSKNRNEIYKELGRVRSFMNLKTSTVKGAEAVRKQREVRGFGMTREEYIKKSVKQYKKDTKKLTKKSPTKKDIAKFEAAASEEFTTLNSEIWSNYRKFLELVGKDTFYGSDQLIDMIGQMTLNDVSETDMLEAAEAAYHEKYEELQDILNSYDEADGIDLEGF